MENKLKELSELLKEDMEKGMSLETANHYYFTVFALKNENEKLKKKIDEAKDFIKYELYDSAKDGDYVVAHIDELLKILNK